MTVHIFARPTSGPDRSQMQEIAALFQAGQLQEALPKAQTLTQEFPKHALTWTLLGAIYRAQHRHSEALPALQKVVELSPADAKSHFNLANAFRDLGHSKQAMDSYQRAMKLQQDLPNGFFHLGNMQHEQGLLRQAERSYRKALSYAPHHVQTLSNLAHVLQDMGRLTEALEGYDQALLLAPHNAALHYNRADALFDLGHLEGAGVACRKALELEPGMALAHAQMGGILKEFGQLEESLDHYRKALNIDPDDVNTRSSLLFSLNYLPRLNRLACLQEAMRYGEAIQRTLDRTVGEWQGNPNPEVLRVGLVSGDFRNHPVGHFLESILGSLDAAQVELIALSTQAHQDELTTRIKSHFAEWHSIAGRNDVEAAELIHGLKLHVVLDLSGHTAGNRLPLFAHRLAPVQATWLGYFATTGVAEMDYLIADPVSLPPECESDFTETIWRLPETRLCFTPPKEAVEINVLPALADGKVTFGSFSNLGKIHDEVIAQWCRILDQVPASRLMLKAKQLRDPAVKAALAKRFADHGMTIDRLVLEGPTDRQSYLEAYHQIDIGLDSFPFPGGTTTAESLWMGVPVLTLKGDHFLSRQGMGLLVNAGLPDWVASNPEDYLAKAVQFANDLPMLANLRQRLRRQVLESPVFDAPRFARHLERALWDMWLRTRQKPLVGRC